MSMSESRGRDLDPADFEAIREAVMETPRGRWFLGEYANRLNGGSTTTLLDGMKRLEHALAANHDALMSRLAEALKRDPAVSQPTAPQTDLAVKHMKFFKQDEEVFEPAPQASITVVKETPKLEMPKGARVVIKRSGEEVAPETAETAPAEAEAEPKRRIVIIRHKQGDTIDVPLQNEMAEAS